MQGCRLMRVGFIGTGEIAATLVRGLAGRGDQIAVSARNATMSAKLAEEMPRISVL